MADDLLTPLRFVPLFKSALWGGQRLRPFLGEESTADTIGEAWLLSDQGTNQSVVAAGPWQGTTLRQLMTTRPERLLGAVAREHERFPLLLKFIDAAKPLSIQVHPTDELARTLEPASDGRGKTEAWVILDADDEARIYAGLEQGTTEAMLRATIDQQPGMERYVAQHRPIPGDCFFLPAGTVHAIGAGLLLFEVQQTSDITYRLSDWGRVDPVTQQPRELHLEKGFKSINYDGGPCGPVLSASRDHDGVRFEALVQCDYFTLDRWHLTQATNLGSNGQCRVLVGVNGQATLRHHGAEYALTRGSVWLLPAEVGECECVPHSSATILECGLS